MGRTAFETLRQALELYNERDYRRAVILLETINLDELGREVAAEACYLWGRVLAQSGELHDAVRKFQQCARLAPGFFPAYDAWANTLARLGDTAGAVAKYRKALSLARDRQPAHVLVNFGQVLLDAGSPARAVRRFRGAFKLDPGRADAAYAAGLCYLRLQRPKGACKWISRAIQLRTENADYWSALGTAHGLAGRRSKAEGCFRRAFGLTQEAEPIHYNWSAMLVRAGDYAAAIHRCKEGLAATPRSYRLMLQQVYCLRSMGAYDAALQACDLVDDALEGADDNELKDDFADLAAANRASCLFATGRRAEARGVLREFLRASRGSGFESISELRRHRGPKRRALARVELTLRVSPAMGDYGTEATGRFVRSYTVLARDVKTAVSFARELEADSADVEVEGRPNLAGTVRNEVEGVTERSPAVATR